MAKYPSNKTRDIKPIKERLTVPWGIGINEKDFEKLITGYETVDMDGQWDVLVENPDKDDNSIISVHFVRSWTGHDIYILHLHNPDPKNGAKVHSITWEGNKNGVRIDAEQAQKEAVLLARDLLKCEFDELPHYDFNEVYNHPAYSRKQQKQRKASG
ncbi:uncharacterized protein PpBr36_09899 [Pyricularia pennisetigena]|uniref:uncharacterized protein n=1 Tax=Pyricularia pennisetigena TaxID=1578925 RepID=UPI00114DB659|nr:uncharacterized protein PpBr36_09899 [Pyricularia pennisetigena]TLS22550.1 hypothetical protein PpBr36_09899 [Pyricularia pennisetigena]